MWIVWFAPQTPATLSGTMGIARYVPQPASLITFAGEDQSGTSPPMPSKPAHGSSSALEPSSGAFCCGGSAGCGLAVLGLVEGTAEQARELRLDLFDRERVARS